MEENWATPVGLLRTKSYSTSHGNGQDLQLIGTSGWRGKMGGETEPLLQTTETTSKSYFIRTIIPFLLLQASVGLCSSLQATFYPIEAELKGATASQFGAVFGIIHLSLFIFGPIVGKYLPIWGVKAIFPAGFIIDGSTFILFGLLEWVEDTTTFLVFSYLIRFIEGVGAAATWTSNLSILMAKFPDRKATVKAWCDASFNFGLTIGPVLGALMYDAGGFFLPFAVTGSAILISGIIVLFSTSFPEMEQGESNLPVARIVFNPRVLIALLTCTVGAYSVGTIEATLSSFLSGKHIDVKMIAVAFLVMSFCSVLATPLFGFLCDCKVSPWVVSAAGSVLMFVCFVFIGPCPYMSFIKVTFISVCGSLVAQGFGSAALLVASFASAQIAAVAAGFPESMEVQAVVSGLFTSSFALGNFCGPTISGVLYDAVGFEYNLLVLQGLVALTFAVNLLSWFVPLQVSRPDQTEANVSATTSSTEDGNKTEPARRISSGTYPELPADIIRSRPAPPRPAKMMRSYSTSSSVYERTNMFSF